jgi:hypothetical protein
MGGYNVTIIAIRGEQLADLCGVVRRKEAGTSGNGRLNQDFYETTKSGVFVGSAVSAGMHIAWNFSRGRER